MLRTEGLERMFDWLGDVRIVECRRHTVRAECWIVHGNFTVRRLLSAEVDSAVGRRLLVTMQTL